MAEFSLVKLLLHMDYILPSLKIKDKFLKKSHMYSKYPRNQCSKIPWFNNTSKKKCHMHLYKQCLDKFYPKNDPKILEKIHTTIAFIT